jgi:hypothetical protein
LKKAYKPFKNEMDFKDFKIKVEALNNKKKNPTLEEQFEDNDWKIVK